MEQLLYNPQTMQQVGQLPLALLWDGMDYLKQAQGQDQATLAEIMAQRQRAGAKHKMDMDQGAATLEQTMLGNQQKQLDLQKNKALQKKTIDTELLKLGAEADEAEWKGFQARVMQGVAQGHPKMLELYKQLPAIQEARLKHQQEMEKVRAQGATQERVANIGADSRRSIAELQAAQRAELVKIKQAVQNKSTDQLMAEYVASAAAATTEEERARFNELANVVASLKAQSAPAGQQPLIDPSKLPPTAPIAAPTKPTVPAKTDTPPTSYTVGQPYKGKTGTYKYLGGDPKNPKSWQKVD